MTAAVTQFQICDTLSVPSPSQPDFAECQIVGVVSPIIVNATDLVRYDTSLGNLT